MRPHARPGPAYDPAHSGAKVTHAAIEARGGEVAAVANAMPSPAFSALFLIVCQTAVPVRDYVASESFQNEKVKKTFTASSTGSATCKLKLVSELAPFRRVSRSAAQTYSSTGHAPYVRFPSVRDTVNDAGGAAKRPGSGLLPPILTSC